MLPQMINVNGCYEYRGRLEGLYGEHGVAIGFVPGKVQTLILFASYNQTLDRVTVYHAYAFELEPIEEGCTCDTCSTAAYGLIRKIKSMLTDQGVVYAETIEQTGLLELEV